MIIIKKSQKRAQHVSWMDLPQRIMIASLSKLGIC